MSTYSLPCDSFVFRGYKPLKYLSDTEKCRVNNRFIYKYVTLDSLEGILSNGIRFTSLDSWPDKGESRFYGADYQFINPDFVRPRVFAACFTRNKQSEASWKGYIDIRRFYENYKQGEKDCQKDAFIVAQLKINRTALKKELSKFCKENGESVLGIYEGEVCYVPSYAFLNCHLPDLPGSQKLHNDLFEFEKGSFGLNEYLSVCLMKRKEIFEYESEIRFFLVKEESDDDIIDVKIDSRHIIEQVKLWRPFFSTPLTQSECSMKAEELNLDSTIVSPADIYLSSENLPITIQKR